MSMILARSVTESRLKSNGPGLRKEYRLMFEVTLEGQVNSDNSTLAIEGGSVIEKAKPMVTLPSSPSTRKNVVLLPSTRKLAC